MARHGRRHAGLQGLSAVPDARASLLRLDVPLAAFALGLVAAAFVFAATGIPSWIPPAPMVRLGIPSPFTGLTRSFVALASGDPRAAFSWHPLGPALFTSCVIVPVLTAAAWVRGRRLALWRALARPVVLWPAAAALAASWVWQIVRP